jgi:hypothetical protein
MEIKTFESFSESSWTEEEKKKLNDCGFYPYWGDESDYRREVSYGDAVDDAAYKWSSNSYSATKHEKEWDDDDYYWNSNTQEFDNFDSLISFLTDY